MALVRSLFSAKKILSRATSAAPKGFLAVYIVFLCHLIDTIMAIHGFISGSNLFLALNQYTFQFNPINITSIPKIKNRWKLMGKVI
ncbi:unnamed protein product [Brassica rapa subsp. trilocularis]